MLSFIFIRNRQNRNIDKTKVCRGLEFLLLSAEKFAYFVHIILNPYRAGQILPILLYVPSVTEVMLLHFVHTLPSVTKVSATIVLQKFCNFACISDIVKFL